MKAIFIELTFCNYFLALFDFLILLHILLLINFKTSLLWLSAMEQDNHHPFLDL